MAHYHTIISNKLGKMYYGALMKLHDDMVLKKIITGVEYLPKRIQQTSIVECMWKTRVKTRKADVDEELITMIMGKARSKDTITGVMVERYQKFIRIRDLYYTAPALQVHCEEKRLVVL